MHLRELRRILQAIVIAGLPASVPACGTVDGGDDCLETIQRTIEIPTPTDPALQLKVDDCHVDANNCADLCSLAGQRANLPSFDTCDVKFKGDEEVVLSVSYEQENPGAHCAIAGRRPSGLGLATPAATTPIGTWLAHAAWLEAASVHAFVALEAELRVHGAPGILLELARLAARDEVRHATLMTTLARRHGAHPPTVVIAPARARTLEALAIENATEGCVRETWGAVLALWQSRTAADADLRAAFAVIARDEVRHAALAWAIDGWIAPQLSAEARARVDLARRAAADNLNTSIDIKATVATLALGLPHGSGARDLIARADRLLWMGGHS